jgi:hypothetical protein
MLRKEVLQKGQLQEREEEQDVIQRLEGPGIVTRLRPGRFGFHIPEEERDFYDPRNLAVQG